MSFINYELLEKAYQDGDMKENAEALKTLDLFHCLFAATPESAAKTKEGIDGLPEDFLKWIEICDGGMLFRTALFCADSHNTEFDLEFDSYDGYNNAEFKEKWHLPDNWFIFAKSICFDLYFFDLSKKDGKVYSWYESEISGEWCTFEDWLIAETDTAVEDIMDETTEPLGIKLLYWGNE